jgi:hypothetical protein
LTQDALAAIDSFKDAPVSCVSLSWGQDEAGWSEKVPIAPAWMPASAHVSLIESDFGRPARACEERL